jgi:hypothetical protein
MLDILCAHLLLILMHCGAITKVYNEAIVVKKLLSAQFCYYI